jgi:alkanesulfonate monooxygenase SsuD/methylene tetrahydromethanopterin reductase-like flavin-dependent oxidoreductase (luciferase family)
VAGLSSIRYWQDLARLLERGCFDGVFFADLPGVADRYRERVDEAIRYGMCWPTHDPAPLVAIMAAATEHLGIAITLSQSAHHPYSAVRTLSTLDCLTAGRVGWNIVTGHLRGEHRAYGLDQLDHDERYARAEEYMEVCYALWNSIEPGAIKTDRQAGLLADPAKVRRVRHAGRYFRTDTVGPVLPSPQHHPVLFQAGSSGRGQEFALRHAEVIFSIQPHAEGMRRLMQQLRETARTLGKPEPVRVTFGVQADPWRHRGGGLAASARACRAHPDRGVAVSAVEHARHRFQPIRPRPAARPDGYAGLARDDGGDVGGDGRPAGHIARGGDAFRCFCRNPANPGHARTGRQSPDRVVARYRLSRL